MIFSHTLYYSIKFKYTQGAYDTHYMVRYCIVNSISFHTLSVFELLNRNRRPWRSCTTCPYAKCRIKMNRFFFFFFIKTNTETSLRSKRGKWAYLNRVHYANALRVLGVEIGFYLCNTLYTAQVPNYCGPGTLIRTFYTLRVIEIIIISMHDGSVSFKLPGDHFTTTVGTAVKRVLILVGKYG